MEHPALVRSVTLGREEEFQERVVGSLGLSEGARSLTFCPTVSARARHGLYYSEGVLRRASESVGEKGRAPEPVLCDRWTVGGAVCRTLCASAST